MDISLLRIQRLFKYFFIILFFIISFTLWSSESYKKFGLFLYILFSTSTIILLFLDIITSDRTSDYTALLILFSALGLIGSSNIILFCTILNNKLTINNGLSEFKKYSNNNDFNINNGLSEFKKYSFIVTIIVAIWCIIFFTTKQNENNRYYFFSNEEFKEICNENFTISIIVYIFKILLSITLLTISLYITYITFNMMQYNTNVNNGSIKSSTDDSIKKISNTGSFYIKHKNPETHIDESIEEMTDINLLQTKIEEQKAKNTILIQKQNDLTTKIDEYKKNESNSIKIIFDYIAELELLKNYNTEVNNYNTENQKNIRINELNTLINNENTQLSIIQDKLDELTEEMTDINLLQTNNQEQKTEIDQYKKKLQDEIYNYENDKKERIKKINNYTAEKKYLQITGNYNTIEEKDIRITQLKTLIDNENTQLKNTQKELNKLIKELKEIDRNLDKNNLENIIVGDNTKLDGAICNVHFYNNPLSKKNIVKIYNKLRLNDPPI
jgi:hypothetical protein